jgi:hypothetical protein
MLSNVRPRMRKPNARPSRKGPPFFRGASSYEGSDPKNPHFLLSKALHVVNWKAKAGTSAAKAGEGLIAAPLAAFRLG